MEEKIVQMVYKEIQKRINEGKLVVMDNGKDGENHYYSCIICVRN